MKNSGRKENSCTHLAIKIPILSLLAELHERCLPPGLAIWKAVHGELPTLLRLLRGGALTTTGISTATSVMLRRATLLLLLGGRALDRCYCRGRRIAGSDSWRRSVVMECILRVARMAS